MRSGRHIVSRSPITRSPLSGIARRAVMRRRVLLVFIACLVSVPLARGKLTAMADLRLRHGWLALAGPAFIYFILTRTTGVPPLEEAMLASRGDAKEYWR